MQPPLGEPNCCRQAIKSIALSHCFWKAGLFPTVRKYRQYPTGAEPLTLCKLLSGFDGNQKSSRDVGVPNHRQRVAGEKRFAFCWMPFASRFGPNYSFHAEAYFAGRLRQDGTTFFKVLLPLRGKLMLQLQWKQRILSSIPITFGTWPHDQTEQAAAQ